MCGIVGVVGAIQASEVIIEGLRRLEYRGYDSAGMAVCDNAGQIQRVRAAGKLRNLESFLDETPLLGATGLGHTRWATHGAPTKTNAHPHQAGRVFVVHNGIIENFGPLRQELEEDGVQFESETDSEVIAKLLEKALTAESDPLKAFQATLGQLRGAYALAVIIEGEDDLIMGARAGAPLIAGLGEGANYLASDALALAPYTNQVIYLDDGEHCVIRREAITVYDQSNQSRPVNPVIVDLSASVAERGNYRHFMEKEIHDQPEVVGRTLMAYIKTSSSEFAAPAEIDFSTVRHLTIVACGTASYAGRVAEYWFERLAGLPTEVDISSEFRYRDPVLGPDDLALFVSQSGETADTLAALRLCKDKGVRTAALVNTAHSTMAREADIVLPTLAGPEIGVASTKAFTCQMAALAGLAGLAGVQRSKLTSDDETRLIRELLQVPRQLALAIDGESHVRDVAASLTQAQTILYLGRDVFYPMALEGALKLKEISYIHAEGYAAGELKHGPIALIDEGTPVIVVAPKDALFDKTWNSIEEVAARGASVILITDHAPAERKRFLKAMIQIPETSDFTAPIISAVALQQLAYYVAVLKGTDVDQPRNLAKSVTVE